MPLPANRKNAKPPKSKTANKQRNSEEHDSSLGLLAPDGYDDNEDLLTMEIPPLPEQMAGCSGPGARLIISHIDVDNFKSYFGHQKIGPFHKNFTAIIGPNGSGKSNVIDSLLFVFGYRASKIRSKKLSALIHSSAGRESIDSCTVAVHFEKIVDISRHEWDVIPESNFYVSRTAYRDGTSKYTLNGRTYQFKDIAKVLRNSGIDLDHSRFLILQGEVEQISMMKPRAETENEEGMLEYLEDIIGSSRLKLPINKFLYKLERLQDKRAAQLLRLQYADKEKSSMEESVKDVISTLYLENAATIVRNKIFSLKRLMLAEKITSCRADLESIAAEIETSQSRNSELIEQFKQLKKQKKELQNSLDDLNVKLAESKANVSTEEQSSSTSVANLKRLQNKKSKLCDNIESANTQIETLKAVPEKAEKEIEIYTMVINSAESTIKETTEIINRKLQTVEHRTAELENKKKAVEAELGKHTVTEDEFSSKVVIAQDELNNLQSAEEKAGQLLAELTEKLDVSQEKCSSKKSEFGKTKEKLPSITNEIETINAELVKCRQEESTLSSRFRDLQLELEQARQSAEEFQSSNRLLSAIMQQKEQGSILGIYGRLGDLGAIDEKYNVAISTTCGPLDDIVVDTVNTAQQCIEFLKRKELGRATFVALDKQQHLIHSMRNRPNTPMNAPRLFDLIQVKDEHVLPAFYYALYDTLVADDITKANQIAFPQSGKRWRTVTLKGEVIETSGAMTGGGHGQKKGRIGQSVKVDTSTKSDDLSRRIQQLKNELDKTDAQLTEARRKLAVLEDNKRKKQTEYNSLNKLMNNAKLDIENLEKAIALLQEQVFEQTRKKRESAVDPAALDRALQELKRLKKERDKVNDITDDLRMKFVMLKEQSEAISNEIMGEEQEQRKEAERRKQDAQSRIAKEKSAIASNGRNLAKAETHKAQLETDLAQLEEDICHLESGKSEGESKLKELKAIVVQTEEEIVRVEGEYKEVDEKSKERNAEELAIQKLQKELQERKRALNGRIVELENKVENFSKEISKLSLFDFEQLKDFPLEVHDPDKIDNFIRPILSSAETEHAIEEDSSNHTDDQMEVDQSSAECNEPPESLTNPRRKVPLFSEEAIKQFDLETLKNQLVKIEERRNEDDVVNMQLLKDYTERLHRYNQESSMYKSISKQRDLHREMCDRLKNQRLSEFMEGFGKVGHALKEMYQMITLGGDASLDLVDSLNPFSEGISFCVRPPKKSWKQIVNLSGGEKTLASLAFVFGLHQYRPTPVYVMDEIDAALDFRNVSIISSYILERTKNAQFVVISLRNNMFERGDRIIGIYKIFDCTHNAVLDPIAAERERQKNAKALKEYAKQSNQINNSPQASLFSRNATNFDDNNAEDDAEALENLSLGSANGTPRTSVGSGPAKRRLFGSSNSPARKRMSNEEFPE